MSNSFPPRLIEVALPIREISAESVRDKSLRHGHISTLHLWWARRPLSAARAIVFASLVPDPDDPRCPPDFRDAVERLLKINVPTILKSYYRGRREIIDSDPYKPYDGIPDTPRNRLLTFIAQWSPESLEFEAGKRKEPPQPKELLDDRSLVKWETSDPKNPQGREVLCIARELVKTAHNGETPTVLDPFAGGGAIPLEAGRLGCQPIANDYNPVAYLILRATCEFPQKYGKPGKRKKIVKEFGKEIEREVEVPNVLAHDFEKWANWILEQARAKIGHLYPPGKVGRPVIGYLWARTAPCSNPSCRAEILLLRSLLVCNKPNKKVALTLEVDRTKKTVSFGITKDKDIKRTEGTALSRGVKCPFCEQITSVDHIKAASFNSQMHERIVAVIVKDKNGKDYRPVEDSDVSSFQLAEDLINPELTPNEPMQEVPDLVSGRGWNFKTWGSLFNPRQLVAMQTFVSCMRQALEEMKAEIPDEEYRKAVGIYLSIFISKISMVQSSFGTYSVTRENIKSPFGRQAIPMVWDYPESNPFSDATAGIEMQIDFLLKTIKHESINSHAAYLQFNDANSINFKNDTISTVITDPPYFDAIAYSDLSDFFYVWLKRCLSDISPEAFQTPLTPKSEEATALKHRHQGSSELADTHFQNKLTQALAEAHRKVKPGGIVTVMFAHQSTKAWTALINAIFNGGLTIDASWPIDTEMVTALKATTSSLASSVTVACRPRIVGSAASFREVRREIEGVVAEAVKRFWSYGLRGADLIVACYGPAVGVFGKYERVEKGDGTIVGIIELLELARRAARDAIAGEFRGDNLSTLYYVWANLYGSAEQAWDDARLVIQVGGQTSNLSDSQNPLEVARGQGIFVVEGSKCRLAMLVDRANRKGLGIDQNPPLIDSLHRAMLLWKEEKRRELILYLSERGLLEDGPFWKLAQSLFEVLPRDAEDWKIVNTLLGERETLRAEGKREAFRKPPELEFGD